MSTYTLFPLGISLLALSSLLFVDPSPSCLVAHNLATIHYACSSNGLFYACQTEYFFSFRFFITVPLSLR